MDFVIDSDIKLEIIVWFIYVNFNIFYMKYEDKYYYQCSTPYSMGKLRLPDEIRKNCHDDIECDEDDENNCKHKNIDKIKITNESKLEYFFTFSNFSNIDTDFKNTCWFDGSEEKRKEDDEEGYNEENNESVNIFANNLKNIDINNLKEIFLDFEKKIIIKNKGYTNDHRGSDHCLIQLPKKSVIKINRKISLYEFAKSLFEIKYNKFDGHYELYCCCDIMHLRNKIKIQMSFDYGS